MTSTTARLPIDWTRLTALDATRDAARLAALFTSGSPPESPDGDCEGRVLGLSGTPFLRFVDVLERLGQALGGIGWTGKTFDPETGTGYNRLTRTSRLPLFLAMPRYGFERRGGQLIGFRFDHRVEASPMPDATMVRAVSYENPAYANPLMLPRTRDELVELTPGLLLGRALLHDESDGWQVVAWFALRHPVGG
jgi:hypothetical protein